MSDKNIIINRYANGTIYVRFAECFEKYAYLAYVNITEENDRLVFEFTNDRSVGVYRLSKERDNGARYFKTNDTYFPFFNNYLGKYSRYYKAGDNKVAVCAGDAEANPVRVKAALGRPRKTKETREVKTGAVTTASDLLKAAIGKFIDEGKYTEATEVIGALAKIETKDED